MSEGIVYETEGATPRFQIKGSSVRLDNRLAFICNMGLYDVYWDKKINTYNVVQEKPEKYTVFNFTDYNIDNNDNLRPADDDVELDPYHMCLLYQVHQEWRYEDG